MLKNLLAVKSPGIEAEKRTLVLASLKLLLFILLLSFCLGKIVLLTLDSTLYGVKGEFVALFWCISVFALGMILDASCVLGKQQQSAAAGKRRGIAGTLLQLFVLIISPVRFPGFLSVIAAAGMLWILVSLLAVMF